MTDAERAERQHVVEIAKSWIGTPYHPHGHVRGAGVDCAWLLIEVYSEAGLIEWFDPGHYPPDWHLHRSEPRYMDWLSKFARPTSGDRMLPGDIIMYRFGRAPAHAGIITDWPMMVHSYVRGGCSSENATELWLVNRIAGYFRPTPWGDD